MCGLPYLLRVSPVFFAGMSGADSPTPRIFGPFVVIAELA